LETKAVTVAGAIVSKTHADGNALFDQQLEEQHEYLRRLASPLMPAQHAYTLIKSSVSTRLSYLARTTMPEPQQQQQQEQKLPSSLLQSHSAFRKFDELILFAFCSKIGMPPPPEPTRLQISLPVSSGGFGISAVAPIANEAWFSSIALTAPIIARYQSLQPTSSFLERVQQLSQLLAAASATPASATVSEEQFDKLPDPSQSVIQFYQQEPAKAVKLQAALTAIRSVKLLQSLQNTQSPQARAKLNSAMDKVASAWLSSPPTTPEQLLTSEEFSIAARLRLLYATPTQQMPSRCPDCGVECGNIDVWHALSCQSARRKALLLRHNAIVQRIAQAVKQASGLARIEPRNLEENTSKQPDLEIFLQGKAYLADVTIRNPLAPSQLAQAASLLDTAARAKSAKYQQLAQVSAAQFVPLVFDVFGKPQQQAVEFMQHITGLASQRQISSVEERLTWQTLKKDISTEIQRFNARTILSWLSRDFAARVKQFQQRVQGQAVAATAPAQASALRNVYRV
jgi:hypothetical protein